uniref:Alpha-galactosidase NEW3 domain-containing protein n=1 Tax=Candidatus Methanogaster sp. ANME-2c ERB4 TaxID=2759911 RepID=A0A7G9YRP7_9EURY|nr:hypothetical protein FFGHKCHG_00035 [Methanosarcinales archaeon ANME-2c ERB4]
MKTRTVSMILTFLLIAGAGIPAVAVAAVPEPMSGDSPDLTDMDFQKLQISPRHSHMELAPGESDEITVTVTNKDNVTVPANPMVVDQPYSDYIFDEDWITITPASTELEPDAEVEFTISFSIPDDAERGHYGLQVAFTDDVMPTQYPSPYPMYLNALDLHVSVWKPPVMQIQPRYIHDMVESNREYDYTINLKNTGDKDIEIDPKLKQERWNRYEMGGPAFEDDAITITAPPVVPADGTATVNVHLAVPLGAKGEYYSGIDLGISDSSSGGWYDDNEMVQLNFEVWTQPTTHYMKGFATETAAPITIEIESNRYRYDMCGGGSSESGDAEEPSFDVVLRGSTGEEVALTRTAVEYRGSVNLGGSDCTPPWEIASSGMYDEGSTSYVERYTAEGAVGTWELCILPHYIEAFEYTVMIGDSET